MKAIVYTSYGPPEVLQLKEVEKPLPKENQVLVKIRAASVNALDYRRFTSQLKENSKVPLSIRILDGLVLKAINTIPGADIAGQVEAVGPNVTQFKPNDEVFGVSGGSVGGFAEYACTGVNNLALKPAGISFEEAAAVPVAGVTALQALRDKGKVRKGQQILIYGASGGVGLFAVQIAKIFGAEVTAVCSARSLEIARSSGADHLMDYNQEDFSGNGQLYNLILAVNGYNSLLDYRRALQPGGVYVAIGGNLPQVLQALLFAPAFSITGKRKMGFMGIVKSRQEDLVYLVELLEAGKIKPVIDKCYPLSETAAAFRYLAEGHARGKVVITIEHK
jgi:NADPH:quinone reductase-like Zn-dependent oxidoreductase